METATETVRTHCCRPLELSPHPPTTGSESRTPAHRKHVRPASLPAPGSRTSRQALSPELTPSDAPPPAPSLHGHSKLLHRLALKPFGARPAACRSRPSPNSQGECPRFRWGAFPTRLIPPVHRSWVSRLQVLSARSRLPFRIAATPRFQTRAAFSPRRKWRVPDARLPDSHGGNETHAVPRTAATAKRGMRVRRLRVEHRGDAG